MTQSISRSLQYAYIAAFGGLLLGLTGWSLKSVSGFSAMADMPLFNGKLVHAFEAHYDKESPIRRLSTSLWIALDYTLFHKGHPDVVIGKDGWLFADEEFKSTLSGQQLEGNWALVRGAQWELNRRGVKLVLTVIPTKARLYPEHIGREQPAALHDSLYQDFLARVRAAGIDSPDLLGSLRQVKDSDAVFLRTDTHWSPLGAGTVARRLGAEIREMHLLDMPAQNFVTRVSKEHTRRSDLFSFLPLDSLFDELLPHPEQLQQHITEVTPALPGSQQPDVGDDFFGDSQQPRLVLVGTSYSVNLRWSFEDVLKQVPSADLINYAKEDKDLLEPILELLQNEGFRKDPSQLLVWDSPGCYLPTASNLSQFGADWVTRLKINGGHDERLATSRNGRANTAKTAYPRGQIPR